MRSFPVTFHLPGRSVTMTKPGDIGNERDRPALALAVAKRSRTHADAMRFIVALGIAQDAAEADALIYEGESEE